MIKVLIAEDMLVTQELLKYIISSESDMQVVGLASNGEEAIAAVKKSNPDVIAMDWQMPKLDGKEATRIIMETVPKPIVIVSGSTTKKNVALSFSLMEAGALAIVKKPNSINHHDFKQDARELVETLRLMSEIKVVRRFRQPLPPPPVNNNIAPGSGTKIVVIGASTGGPMVLQKILTGLPNNIKVPIFIVQHISHGFVEGFAEWLSKVTGFPIHIARHGDLALPGHAYVAPDGFHLGVEKGPRIILSNHPPENGLRPSVAYLFRTTAAVFGPDAIGILLTGMGRDGAEELKLMKDKGALTIVQDEISSVVFGMPGEALRLKAAGNILIPEAMNRFLSKL